MNYYEILQISPDADADTVKAAHRRLAKQYHPDFNRAPDAKTAMQRINEAYGVLSDPSKRASYDQKLQAARQPSSVWAGMPEARRTYAQDVVERSMWQRESGVSLREKKRDFYDAWRAIMPNLAMEQNCVIQLNQNAASKLKVHFAIPEIKLLIDIDKRETLQAFNAITETRRYDNIETWHVVRFSEAEMFSDPHECAVITHDIVHTILDDLHTEDQAEAKPPPRLMIVIFWFAAWMAFGVLGFATGLLLAHVALTWFQFKPLILVGVHVWLWLFALVLMAVGWLMARAFGQQYAVQHVTSRSAWGLVATVAIFILSMTTLLNRHMANYGLERAELLIILLMVSIASLATAFVVRNVKSPSA
ncbi:MAG: J domain-containing protein [Herpetosiphon sp.]|nr:J domain-containing protein [Herpetosiphon sp.]